MKKFEVEMPEDAFNTLASWASVGRTIDQAVRLLEAYSDSIDDEDIIADIQDAVQELTDLKYPLDKCMDGARSKRNEEIDRTTVKLLKEPYTGDQLFRAPRSVMIALQELGGEAKLDELLGKMENSRLSVINPLRIWNATCKKLEIEGWIKVELRDEK